MHKALCEIAFGVAVSSIACGGSDLYVWARDLPNASPGSDYVISAGDVLSVRVLNQDSMTTRARVRADGRIEVPLLGEVDARGKGPAALKSELESGLKQFFQAPVVTLNVEESPAIVVAVVGEVTRPANVTLEHDAGVLQALAAAGGLTEFANRSRIFVMRPGRPATKVRFTFSDLSRVDDRSAAFRLEAGDVVIAE